MPGDQSPQAIFEPQPKSGSGMQWLAQEMRSDAFWRHLPAEIQAGLTPVQEAAIRAVAAGTEPAAHAVDYRASMHLPILGNIYVVLMVGRERRNQLRRSLDHALRSGSRWSNAVALAVVVGCVVLVSGASLLLYSALQ